MAGAQAQRTLDAMRKIVPDAERRWKQIAGSAESPQTGGAPGRAYTATLSRCVRELCEKHGLRDRMPRCILPGPLATNKRIAERLALKVYDLELAEQAPYRLWAYRKAVWTVDEWPESIADLFHERGEDGIAELPGIGRNLAKEIASWITEASSGRTPGIE